MCDFREYKSKKWIQTYLYCNFYRKNGNPIDWQDVNYQWNVVSDFEVNQTTNENKITVSVNDENLIGGSFFVSVCIDEIILSEIKINIVE